MTFTRLVASGFGSGFAPFAPGTVGSFIALVLGAFLMALPSYALVLAIVIATIGGFWAIHVMRMDGDPGWVVIDEVAGQWISLLGLTRASLPGLFAAFIIFRVLDIMKPGPIGWADRQRGAAGIMADDIVAGAITAGVIWSIRLYWPAPFDAWTVPW